MISPSLETYPTGSYEMLWPQNQEKDGFYVVHEHRPTDFKAQNL